MSREEAIEAMVAWLVLFVLVIVEAASIGWWLRKEYYPVIFNGWASLLYTALLAVDFVIAWLVSQLVTPGGSGALGFLIVVGVLATVAVALLTLFFRWVIRTDITDIPGKQ